MNATAALEVGENRDLLAAYMHHSINAGIGRSSANNRRQHAAKLLRLRPDLGAWMDAPLQVRMADLRRTQSWPFVMWCMAAGHLRANIDLLLGKPMGVQLSPLWDGLHPGDRQRAAAVAEKLGFGKNWVYTTTTHCFPMLCVWAGKTLDQLTETDIVDCKAAVAASPYLSLFVRRKTRIRLTGIARILFEMGLVARAPRRHGSTARTATERTAETISQPELRRDVVRYSETVSTVLRPSSADSRMKAIYVFCNWLAEHHPGVQRLDQLERSAHMEPFLAWARARPWRGANGASPDAASCSSATCRAFRSRYLAYCHRPRTRR